MGRDCCEGKIRHERIGAIIAAKKLKNRQMEAYRCPKCGGWHVGHSSKDYKIQQRISQLLKGA